MKRFSILFSILVILASNSLFSISLTPFKAKDGLASAQSQANKLRADAKLVSVATTSGSIPGVSGASFDYNFKNGKSNAWLYLFRSISPNDSLIAIGVVNVFVFIPQPVAIALIPENLINNSYTELASEISNNAINSDAMCESLLKDSKFNSLYLLDSNIKPSVCVLYQNTKDTFELKTNNPYWLTVFGSLANSDLTCFTDALTGETKCFTKAELNVEDSFKNNSFLYPNPASNFINIKFNIDANIENELAIFSSNGSLVKKVKFSDNLTNYSIADLANGSYIAIITSGDKSSVMPLVINK